MRTTTAAQASLSLHLDKMGVVYSNAHLWQLRKLMTKRYPAMLQNLL